MLVDECCQLSSQLVIPDIGLSLPARGLASPLLFNPLPLQVALAEFNILSVAHDEFCCFSGNMGLIQKTRCLSSMTA